MSRLQIVAAQCVTTVFFNGMGSTRVQGVRYADEIVTTKNGEVYYRARSMGTNEPLLFNVLPAEDFDDIHVVHDGGGEVREERRQRRGWWHFWVDWTAHTPGTIVYIPSIFQFFSMGGGSEMAKGVSDIRRALDWKRQDPSRRVMVYGWSRGAHLALLAAGALDHAEQQELDWVVAEAPPDHIPNVIHDRVCNGRLLSRVPFLPALLHILFSVFPWHTSALHAPPLTGVRVIIGSGERDSVCPIEGQRRLVRKLRADGANVTHVVAKGADHGDIVSARVWRDTVSRAYTEILPPPH